MTQRLLLDWANLAGLILLRYLILAGTAYLLFYVALKHRWLPAKIQKRFPGRADYQREIAYSILSSVIFALVGLLVLASPLTVHFRVYRQFSDYPVWYHFLSVGLMLITHETYFYWTHRLMHSPRLYRAIHLVHHQSTNPSPWAAQAFHPAEALIEAGVIIVFALLFPVHPTVLALFMLFSFSFNVYGHLGFELLPGWVNQSGWINTSTDHNLHHSRVNGNYGLYFTVWDRLMNTAQFGKPSPTRQKVRGLISLLLLSSLALPAQAVPPAVSAIAGDWYIDRKEAVVRIYQQSDGTVYGQLIWASDPRDNDLLRERKPVLVLKRFRLTRDGVLGRRVRQSAQDSGQFGGPIDLGGQ